MADPMMPPPPPPSAEASGAQRPWWRKKWAIAVGVLVVIGAIAGADETEEPNVATASFESPIPLADTEVSTTVAPTTTEAAPTTTEPPTTTTAAPTTLPPTTTTTTVPPPPPTTAPAPTAPPTTEAQIQPAAPTSSCSPGYSPCLPPASDYDCAGGSGNGPEYTGTVSVDGSFGDPYDLDRDGDGVGCD